MTIIVGWWALPAFFTVAAFGGYALWSAKQPPSSGYGNIGDGIAHAFILCVALICSLIAWLIYALLT